jgi:hypothetical protein
LCWDRLGDLSVYVADERFEVEMKEERSETEKRRVVGSLCFLHCFFLMCCYFMKSGLPCVCRDIFPIPAGRTTNVFCVYVCVCVLLYMLNLHLPFSSSLTRGVRVLGGVVREC